MTTNTPLEEMHAFFDAFRQESDRACAVLGAALLEHRLKELLTAALLPEAAKHLLRADGALGTAGALRDLCFGLGLLPSEEKADLEIVARIRNKFAHRVDHQLSFASLDIANQTRALSLPDLLTKFAHLSDSPIAEADQRDIATKPRRRFEVAVGILAVRLIHASNLVIRPSKPQGIIEFTLAINKRSEELHTKIESAKHSIAQLQATAETADLERQLDSLAAQVAAIRRSRQGGADRKA